MSGSPNDTLTPIHAFTQAHIRIGGLQVIVSRDPDGALRGVEITCLDPPNKPERPFTRAGGKLLLPTPAYVRALAECLALETIPPERADGK